HVETPGEVRVRRLRGRAGPVNLLPVDFADPPSLRGVVRGILGVAMALAGLALVVVSIGAGHIEWRLAALVLALWEIGRASCRGRGEMWGGGGSWTCGASWGGWHVW